MSRKFLNQKGLTPVILLILLVGGLAAGLYAFNYARTVVKPQAAERDAVSCTYKAEICDEITQKVKRFSQFLDTDGQCESKVESLDTSCANAFCAGDTEYCNRDMGKVVRQVATRVMDGICITDPEITDRACGYSSQGANCEFKATYCDLETQKVAYTYSRKLPDGSCEPKTQVLDQTCVERFCPDNDFEYCDDVKFSPGKVIRKVNARYVNSECVYDYDQASDKSCADLGKPDRRANEVKINPTLKCNAGEKDLTNRCAQCNSSGTGWNPSGTDWGNFSTDPDVWCGCARQYSNSSNLSEKDRKEFSNNTFPQCIAY